MHTVICILITIVFFVLKVVGFASVAFLIGFILIGGSMGTGGLDHPSVPTRKW